MINDLISDGLTRIRNAAMRRLDTTKLLHSKVVEATLSILAAKGYIESYNVVEENNKKFINVVLKYDERGRSVINEIKRVLKPDGYLFLRLNSTNSKEYKKIIENNEKEIESHLFFSKNMEKRFFDENDINNFFKDFKIIFMKEENMSRWCADKIIWKCAAQNIKLK